MSLMNVGVSLKMMKWILLLISVCLVLEIVGGDEEIRCIPKERQALLQFKASLVDEYGMLSSWNNTNVDCCQWKGIRCNNLTGHVFSLDLHGEIDKETVFFRYSRVIKKHCLSGDMDKSLMELQQLQYLNLSGNHFQYRNIPHFLASLTNLRSLDLSHSEFGGNVPTQLGSLSHLKYLNLALNGLEGSIPYQLANLSNLQYLDLSFNSLKGKIPSQLGKLSNLQTLSLGQRYDGDLKIDDGNHMRGQWLSNLTSLTHLYFHSISDFHTSHSYLQIITKLPKLRELSLRYCSLSDHFILSLRPFKFNFSTSLSVLDLSGNTFSSSMVLEWISNITSHLHELDLSGNYLEGGSTSNHFATKMVKLPKLRELSLSSCDLSDNFLHLMTPSKFNFSTSLSVLDLSDNTFTSSKIFSWVSNLNSSLTELDLSGDLLERLDLSYNSLNGGVLNSFFNICTLHSLYMARNDLTEDLASILHNLSHGCIRNSLQELDLSNNQIIGTLTDLSIFSSLKTLDLSTNCLSGKIPEGIKLPSQLESLSVRSNTLEGGIPKSFGNACNLEILDLSDNNLNYELPMIIHHLSGCASYSLQNLNLGRNQINGTLPNLSIFSTMKRLDISENQLNGKISEGIKLPSQLQSLSIQSNTLEGGIPKSFGNACSLEILDLSDNNLNYELSMIIHHLTGCASYSLQNLNLGRNQIHGTLPNLSIFSTMKRLDISENRLNGKISEEIKLPSELESLYVQSNTLEGEIPKSFLNAPNLGYLYLSNNSLRGELPMIIHNSLIVLDLSMNQISGTLPNLLVMFPSLKILYLYGNKLNGTISKELRFPAGLELLDLSSNILKGVITDSHFLNMSALSILDLSDNLLTLAFPQNWIPHFQLSYIGLRSCKLGPTFPMWLQMQNNFDQLDISNNRISNVVPKWFWGKLASQDWSLVNISYNNLSGIIPNVPLKNDHLSLTLESNQFEGHIPSFLRGVVSLNLSKNKFSNSHSFLCADGTVETLYQLDLSNNQLSGQIPNCWGHFKSLTYLDLSHNTFSGKIPTSIGSLHDLQVLFLRNNNLIEDISFSLRNCTKLVMLDMAENRLSGPIPTWIGSELQNLEILSFGRNHFFGSLPLQICYLKKVQILDLSQNNLCGQIPKCIENFTLMTQKTSSGYYQGHWYFVNTTNSSGNQSYNLNVFLMWKGSEQMFKNKESLLLKSIDLSSNHFSGEIPIEIENLFELISLNLSRNNLTGKIPSNIGKLASLEFLDLSRNQLIDSIPSSLAQIDRLAMLDLSHNNLSGEIPTGTQLQSFNASSYEDNLDLCGPPLEKLCIHGNSIQKPIVKLDEDEYLLLGPEFYMSMAFGFVIGFWGVFGSLLAKRSWRHAYFKFLNKLANTVHV